MLFVNCLLIPTVFLLSSFLISFSGALGHEALPKKMIQATLTRPLVGDELSRLARRPSKLILTEKEVASPMIVKGTLKLERALKHSRVSGR